MVGDGEVLKGAQKKKSKNKNNNSRRFSDEQIKSLESLFKMENKLEPRKKLEMARELGLHPRQLRNLCNQLKEPHELGSKLDMESGSENGDMITLELNGSGPLEQDMAIYNSDEDDTRKHNTDHIVGLQKLQQLDHENIIVNMEEAHETVSNFDDLGSLFEQYSTSSNWWDV
ncbi:hypothetical protein L6452_12706 [Arctium lappa]|uniref:Uncharacterized protein n=1 Tax=Arctium lappa TaxID=4217 RepID=A0ACB9DRJ9_ARCLA|nr:hypothetical protein L6452_12706 [Arctium lappa]